MPGVTIFAWMCAPALDRYGDAWLEGGRIDARFVSPVYEGDDVVVLGTDADGGLAIGVRRDDVACAVGRADGTHDVPVLAVPNAEVPSTDVPPAGPSTLVPGRVLGSISVDFEAQRAREYLASIAADHPIPADRGVAHPGWLLLLANMSLSSNVALGPWIHVSSDVALHGAVADGETVSARTRVVAEYERKEHRFVDLDVALVAGKRPVASVRHVAIYEPRRLKR